MDNPETLATLGTQDTGQRVEYTKGRKLATLGTQVTDK